MSKQEIINWVLANLNYYERYAEIHPNNDYVRGVIMILNKLLKRLYDE